MRALRNVSPTDCCSFGTCLRSLLVIVPSLWRPRYSDCSVTLLALVGGDHALVVAPVDGWRLRFAVQRGLWHRSIRRVQGAAAGGRSAAAAANALQLRRHARRRR